MTGTQDRHDGACLLRAAPWLAFALAVLAVFLTYDDFGTSWDEATQSEYGELAVRYFETGGEDTSVNSYVNMRFYGTLFEMLPALFYEVGAPDKYRIRHLVLGLICALGIPGAWFFGRRMGGPAVAALGVLAVATLPRFFGHWFNNSKDPVFAVGVIWYLVSLVALFGDARVRWSRAIGCGVAMGLALCARPGGLPLFVAFLCAGAVAWLVTREPNDGEELRSALLGLASKLLVAFAVAWAIMVAPWPWAHESPLLNPVRAMRMAAQFETVLPLPFEGVMYQSDVLPRYYIAKYVLIGNPPTVLVLALVGLVLSVREQLAAWRTPRALTLFLAQVWLLMPIALYAIVRPNVYGGMRHFVFVLPALGLFAGLGAAGILRLLRGARARAAGWAAAVVLVLVPLVDLVRFHPYQNAYYNGLVGGVAGASGDYWTDYWVASYGEAIEWVNQQAAREPERRFVVLIAAGPPVMQWVVTYAAENVELVALQTVQGRRARVEPADFFIGTTRNDLHQSFPDAPIVHTVGRAGAVFTVVRGRSE